MLRAGPSRFERSKGRTLNPVPDSALNALREIDTRNDCELDICTRLAAERFGARVVISLTDNYRRLLQSDPRTRISASRLSSSLCIHTLTSDRLTIVPDARGDPRSGGDTRKGFAKDTRFYAGAPIVLADGQRVGTFSVIDRQPRTTFTGRDIAALELMTRQVKGVLESKEARLEQRVLELLARTTTDAFVCTDASGRIIHWNHGAESMFGWSRQEAVGQPMDLIIPHHKRAAHYAGMAEVMATGRTKLVGTMVEVSAMAKDDREVPVELSLAMWPSEAEGKPEGFAAIMRNISGRKKSEARIAEQIAALDASHDGIALTDPQGSFVFMNKAHAQMFGYDDPNEFIGRKWSVLYDDEEAKRIDEEVMPVLAALGQWRGETQGIGRNGNLIEQEVVLSLSPGGGILCVTRDIGERLTSERETSRLRDQLAQAQRQEIVGQLASGVAHDCSNLIAAIAATTHLLLKHDCRDVRGHACRIQSATTAATALVEKLLTLGRRKRSTKQVDLGQAIRNVRELLKPSLLSHHSIELTLPERAIIALADETEVTQVILNLALNARSALPESSAGRIRLQLMNASGHVPQGSIMVGAVPSDDAALIRITDTGIGIPEDLMGRIFDPFFSQKGDAGTGLGLAVVASIIAEIGGAIAVQSAPGAGTIFEVWWPLQISTEDSGLKLAPPPSVTGKTAFKCALLVDDDHAAMELLIGMLETTGVEAGPCLDPIDAIAALEEDPGAWDLLITDYDMPSMNGAQLAEAARRIRPQLPIVLLSALRDPVPLLGNKAALFDGMLRKPTSGEELAQALVEAMLSAERRSA